MIGSKKRKGAADFFFNGIESGDIDDAPIPDDIIPTETGYVNEQLSASSELAASRDIRDEKKLSILVPPNSNQLIYSSISNGELNHNPDSKPSHSKKDKLRAFTKFQLESVDCSTLNTPTLSYDLIFKDTLSKRREAIQLIESNQSSIPEMQGSNDDRHQSAIFNSISLKHEVPKFAQTSVGNEGSIPDYKKIQLKKGDRVMAKFAANNLFYPASVKSVIHGGYEVILIIL